MQVLWRTVAIVVHLVLPDFLVEVAVAEADTVAASITVIGKMATMTTVIDRTPDLDLGPDPGAEAGLVVGGHAVVVAEVAQVAVGVVVVEAGAGLEAVVGQVLTVGGRAVEAPDLTRSRRNLSRCPNRPPSTWLQP